MSGGMPELGSKISLISKADIRYEGRLYTVDPQECTIALSSVRSFGTEDRETQFQIAPQSQIYDYILFRGSDIKDIRVVNNSLPHPNDPAIMQVQLQNGQHMMPPFPMPSMNPPHAQALGAGYAPFGGMGGLGIGSAGASGSTPSLAPGSAPGPFLLGGNQQLQQQQKIQQQQPQQKQPNIFVGASRSTTPISLISRKSPSADMGVQATQQPMQQHHPNNQHQPTGNNAVHGGNSRDAGQKRQNHQQRVGNNNNNSHQRNSGANNNDFYQHGNDRRDSGRNMDNNYNHDTRNNYQGQRNQGGGGGGGGGQNRGWTMNRPSNNVNNGMMRNRGGGGGGGGGGGRGRMPNQGYRPLGGGPGAGNQNKPRPGKTTIKFEQDFDFEQANNKFEELRSQLSKLKVGEEQPKTAEQTKQTNGEVDKKDDSGNETGAGDHEPEDEEITVGYDKTKSFFDNISCEAAQDRAKNKKNDWRQERKLNSETFGVSSTRRGNFRGRGNYYNRNSGVHYGDYAGGHRVYRGYRNRSNNHMGGGPNRNVGAARDNTNSNANTNTNTSNNDTATKPTTSNSAAKTSAEVLKAQPPQVSSTAVAAAAAAATSTSGTGASSSTAAAPKTTSQETTTQPQVAAIVAGQ